MKIETKFDIGQKVYFIRGKENNRIDMGEIYGFVNEKVYRLRSHGKHLTKDISRIFVLKEEAEQRLKELRKVWKN